MGGLNVGSLRGKNWALLGKWWWRFRVEVDALWVKVVKSIHGIDEGWLDGVYHGEGGVWGDIMKIGLSIDKLDVGFTNSFLKEVGNGENTRFWDDVWVGNCRLRDKFPRLFRLERNKGVNVRGRVLLEADGWR